MGDNLAKRLSFAIASYNVVVTAIVLTPNMLCFEIAASHSKEGRLLPLAHVTAANSRSGLLSYELAAILRPFLYDTMLFYSWLQAQSLFS